MKDGFVKVAAGTPAIRVADCSYNAQSCINLIREAWGKGVKVLVLPELCLTGYTCGDLFLQDTLLKGAEQALRTVLEATADMDMLVALGLPVRERLHQRLYNCAAVVQGGVILGVVPKTYIPNYGEFYEGRWFAPAPAEKVDLVVELAGQTAILSAHQLFAGRDMQNLTIGVEVCEDLWGTVPPSSEMAAQGACVILNLSASNEMVGKADYRRQLVTGQSARLICGYIYAGAGEGESSTDLVFAGHNMIAENGVMLAEQRFATGLVVSELDLERLAHERQRITTFPAKDRWMIRDFGMAVEDTVLTRPISPTPFVPTDQKDKQFRCWEILTMAATGLKTRLKTAGVKTAVVGLSGGLDSTLAILITAMAFDQLGWDYRNILAVTMPCFGTTERTRSNAELLAKELGADLRVVDISAVVTQHFRDIGQSMDDHSVTFENAQARERTQVLMDMANQSNGMVIGTGDLSELALGWATYNGDHMSMYGVNASIPKTLVRHLVAFAAQQRGGRLGRVLEDIIDTPVSPELLPPKDGEITQKTEDLVGPYELHDFFLYHAIRWGCPPRKVFRMAVYAMGERYPRSTILHWLKNFYRRFFAQQFKRSCLPDGPKVGSVTLSPRGDWRMPSDGVAALWLEELEGIE